MAECSTAAWASLQGSGVTRRIDSGSDRASAGAFGRVGRKGGERCRLDAARLLRDTGEVVQELLRVGGAGYERVAAAPNLVYRLVVVGSHENGRSSPL